MDPVDFLNLATNLICSTDEAERRTAISRAYYYVYHHIKRDLVGPDNNLSHDVMINCIQEATLDREEVEEFETLAEDIGNLKTDRTFADYKIHKYLSPKTCRTMIDRCQEAVRNFEQCKQAGLVDAARDYLRSYRYLK